MLGCLFINVVFDVDVFFHQLSEGAGGGDQNLRFFFGFDQDIKADFLHRAGSRQRADLTGTGGEQRDFPLLAGLDKDAELAGEDEQNAETVIVTAVEKIAALIRRQNRGERKRLLPGGGKFFIKGIMLPETGFQKR